jgi:hypothetical protein
VIIYAWKPPTYNGVERTINAWIAALDVGRTHFVMNYQTMISGKQIRVCFIIFMWGMANSSVMVGFSAAQEKPKGDEAVKKDLKPSQKEETKKAVAIPQKDDKKVDVPAPVKAVIAPPPEDPAKLKEEIGTLRKQVATLELKVVTLELEKLGAIVIVDKAKDGKETVTVNILKKWSGDKDGLQLLKKVPKLQVVYIDNAAVSDASVAPLKDLADLSALTLMSPQFTDAGLDNLKGLTNLTMLFLTNSKVGDKGLSSLKSLKNLQVLALSRTDVTDSGMDSLKEMKSLKSIYLIGTKVTPRAVEKLKQTLPGVAVYR